MNFINSHLHLKKKKKPICTFKLIQVQIGHKAKTPQKSNK